MSWLRSKVNKAVEAGGENILARTVRSYADSVVSQAGRAVAEGAKFISSGITTQKLQNFKHNVKRLEEVAVSCRGSERVLLLRRWLIALEEVEKLSTQFGEVSGKGSEKLQISDESKTSPRKPVLVLYHDPDIGGEPMTFRDVFLYSQALEGMTLSMILEAPNEEEVKLLLEIYGLCLAGGGEVHSATMSSLQDLANAFGSYEEEVLVKREELLEYAQGAIAGLKIKAEIARIDSEMLEIKNKLDGMKPKNQSEQLDSSSESTAVASLESLKEALAQVQLCSRLKELLLKKKHLTSGDSPNIHAQKVDKLKVLSESLANSASKTERRILDHSLHKEEAIKFRVTKSSEVNQTEKEVVDEIRMLETQRDKLEAELKKVHTSIAATKLRLRNVREEQEQFEEASNEIMAHLKIKEDELSRSIASYKAEADVCNLFVNFLEDTWMFQSKFTEQNEKVVNDELEKYDIYFKDLAIHLLSAYKEELSSSISTYRELVGKLNSRESDDKSAVVDNGDSRATDSGKNLEDVYVTSEAKFISAFSIVEGIEKQLCSLNKENSRPNDERIKELLDNLEKIKEEFESIERPVLKIKGPQSKEGTPKASPRCTKSPQSKSSGRHPEGAYTPMHLEESPVNSPTTPKPNLAVLSINRSKRDLNKPTPATSDEIQSIERSKSEKEKATQIAAPSLKENPSAAKHDEVSQSSSTGGKKTSQSEEKSLKLKPELEKNIKENSGKVSPSFKTGGEETLIPEANLSKLKPELEKDIKEKPGEVSQSFATGGEKISIPKADLSKIKPELLKGSKEKPGEVSQSSKTTGENTSKLDANLSKLKPELEKDIKEKPGEVSQSSVTGGEKISKPEVDSSKLKLELQKGSKPGEVPQSAKSGGEKTSKSEVNLSKMKSELEKDIKEKPGKLSQSSTTEGEKIPKPEADSSKLKPELEKDTKEKPGEVSQSSKTVREKTSKPEANLSKLEPELEKDSKEKPGEVFQSSITGGEKISKPEADLSKLKPELEKDVKEKSGEVSQSSKTVRTKESKPDANSTNLEPESGKDSKKRPTPKPEANPLKPNPEMEKENKAKTSEVSQSSTFGGEKTSKPEANLLALKPEMEKDIKEKPGDEIGGWEFDELEKELEG